MPGPPEHQPVWKPLEIRLFRALWAATVVSNIGSEMRNAVAAVFMTQLTSSALVVALVASAAALPIFLLSLPAGALADVLDRRRLLLVTHIWMLLAAGALGVLTFLHVIWPVRVPLGEVPGSPASPWILLGLTFLLGMGVAMTGPAFLRVLPELVPPVQMPSAMALNSIALNVARALGPALGGLMISLAGPGAAFTLNAVSFAAVAWVLLRWRHNPAHHPTSPEGVVGAMRAGLRYARHAPRLLAVLARVAAFVFCASAMWSLAAVLATRELKLGEVGYCMLMAFQGVGAILGIVVMPWAQRRISTERVVGWATAGYAVGLAALALCRVVPATCAIMFYIGATWVVILTNFNVATQRAVPAWVKGRAMSLYLLTLWGAWAAGAAVWGTIASKTNAPVAMLVATGGLVVGLLALPWLRLAPRVEVDLSPAFPEAAKAGGAAAAADAADTTAAGAPDAGDDAVDVEIAYRIEPGRSDEFLALMHRLRRQRLRNGAKTWALVGNGVGAGSFIERFSFVSAREFSRQRGRITRWEADLEEQALALHVGADRPVAGGWALPPAPRGATEAQSRVL